ncbi:MAG: DHH family phosphoesterase [Ignisphaera sp.]
MCLKEQEHTWLESLEKLRSLITNNRYTVIIPHANADPDALAASCAIAYMVYKLNKAVNVSVAIPEGVGLECKKISELCTKNNINVIIVKKLIGDLFRDHPLCFLVDVASIEQTKILKNYLDVCSNIVIIDHHESHNYESITKYLNHTLQFICSEVTSASEIVFDILKYFNVKLPKDILEALLAGILWDTKHFSRATSKTFRHASEILELGADYQQSRQLVSTIKPPYAKLAKIKCVLRHKGFKAILNARDVYIAVSEIGAYESECASSLVNIGYDIAFVVSEEETINAIRIIYRTREDVELLQSIDVYNDILKPILQKHGGGGGGHRSAGGAIVNVADVNTILKEIIEILSNITKGKIVELAEQRVFDR